MDKLSQEHKIRELVKQWRLREETILKFSSTLQHSSAYIGNFEKIRKAIEEVSPFLTRSMRNDLSNKSLAPTETQIASEYSEQSETAFPQTTEEKLVDTLCVIAEAIDNMSKQSSDVGREGNEIAVRSLAVSVEANTLSRWAIGISLVASLIAAIIASGFWFKFFGC